MLQTTEDYELNKDLGKMASKLQEAYLLEQHYSAGATSVGGRSSIVSRGAERLLSTRTPGTSAGVTRTKDYARKTSGFGASFLSKNVYSGVSLPSGVHPGDAGGQNSLLVGKLRREMQEAYGHAPSNLNPTHHETLPSDNFQSRHLYGAPGYPLH